MPAFLGPPRGGQPLDARGSRQAGAQILRFPILDFRLEAAMQLVPETEGFNPELESKIQDPESEPDNVSAVVQPLPGQTPRAAQLRGHLPRVPDGVRAAETHPRH